LIKFSHPFKGTFTFIIINNIHHKLNKEKVMKRRFVTTLLVLFVIPAIAFSQNKQVKGKHLIFDQPTVTKTTSIIPESVTADGDYIFVDLMGNVFGFGSGDINPLAFDPYSGTLALIHRGDPSYATSSGELWYNISQDAGANWTRVASINGGASQQFGRYPSMAISNPTKGDINSTTGAFSWPELNPTTFGWVGYGVDQPLGAGFTFAGIIQGANDFSSEAPTWASDNSPWVYWSERSLNLNAAVTFFRTQDFITIESYIPPQWADSVFSSNGQYLNGGISYNGVDYMCAIGAFNLNIWPSGNDVNGWPIGYSKSSDNGTTWSNFQVPDWRTIPALQDYDQNFDFDSTDGNTVQYDGDIQVDKWGYAHLVTALTDTNTWSHAVVDIFETATGWDGEVIFNGLDIKTYGAGPGLGQMGPSTFAAMDSSHTVMAVQWINKSPNTQWADVYFSHKRLGVGDTWSDPINLTMSDSINNTAAHLAPQIMDEGDQQNFMAFSSYCYVTGVTGPYSDTTQSTSIYVASVPFFEELVGVDDDIVVNEFNLEQNYPNPFNPSTTINYTLAERGQVTLRVYDVLGNEVATLVNTTEEAGKHNVKFDASKLSSGIYIYKLNTGNFTSSKKMMLLK
jgi:hypothetical protein